MIQLKVIQLKVIQYSTLHYIVKKKQGILPLNSLLFFCLSIVFVFKEYNYEERIFAYSYAYYPVNTSNSFGFPFDEPNSSICTQPSFVLFLLSILLTALNLPAFLSASISVYNL